MMLIVSEIMNWRSPKGKISTKNLKEFLAEKEQKDLPMESPKRRGTIRCGSMDVNEKKQKEYRFEIITPTRTMTATGTLLVINSVAWTIAAGFVPFPKTQTYSAIDSFWHLETKNPEAKLREVTTHWPAFFVPTYLASFHGCGCILAANDMLGKVLRVSSGKPFLFESPSSSSSEAPSLSELSNMLGPPGSALTFKDSNKSTVAFSLVNNNAIERSIVVKARFNATLEHPQMVLRKQLPSTGGVFSHSEVQATNGSRTLEMWFSAPRSSTLYGTTLHVVGGQSSYWMSELKQWRLPLTKQCQSNVEHGEPRRYAAVDVTITDSLVVLLAGACDAMALLGMHRVNGNVIFIQPLPPGQRWVSVAHDGIKRQYTMLMDDEGRLARWEMVPQAGAKTSWFAAN